jgi:hypothetical protein
MKLDHISNSVESFVAAVDRGASISFSSDGTWHERSLFSRIIRCIIRVFFKIPEDSVDLAVQLDRFLSSKIVRVQKKDICGFSAPSFSFDVHTAVSAVRRSLDRIRASNDKVMALADHMQEERMKTVDPKSQSHLLVDKCRDTVCRSGPLCASANLFRTEQMISYLSKPQSDINAVSVGVESVHPENVEWLEEQCKKWQTRQYPYVDYFADQQTIDNTRAKLRRYCQYEDFLEESKKNPVLLEQFFYHVFRNLPNWTTDSVDIFIQSFFILGPLHKGILDKRLCEFSVKGIEFVESGRDGGKVVKDVRLLINGSMQSISNQSSIVKVSEKTSMTVRQLFDKFAQLEFGFIDFEYLEDGGVREFDSRLPQLKSSDTDWWKKLPLVQRMTKEQLAAMYGVTPGPDEHLLILRASRQTPSSKQINENHAWMDIPLPLPDGTYNVISVGKFAYRYPRGLWETLKFAFSSQRASIVTVDPNRFARQRERIGAPVVPLDNAQFSQLMDIIRDDIVRANKHELVFQAQGDNCASWVRKVLFQVVPNYEIEPFEMMIKDAEAPAPLSALMSVQKVCSEDVWNFVRITTSAAMGATQPCVLSDGHGGKRTVRLVEDKKWVNGLVNLPANFWNKASQITKATLAAVARKRCPTVAV